MTRRTNLNADMGEGYGAYEIGADEALLQVVKSASIACGFHGGDFRIMHRLARLAGEKGVSIGAHPGFNDLWGMGRRRIAMPADEAEYMIAYQIGALQALASYSGVALTHVKPHGALYHMAAEDEALAGALARGVKAVDPSLILVGLAGSSMQEAAERLGLCFAREGFADRAYLEDGTLAPRNVPGSVIHDPGQAVEQVLRIVEEGEVITLSGSRIAIDADTICLHSDAPNAALVGTAVAEALAAAGVANVPLPELF